MAMTSLFGPTPAQIEEARRLQSRQEIAQEAEPFGVFAPLYAASRNLTRTGTQSLVSGLFPEAQDPALREAQAVESIRQKYMGQNMTDPKVLQQMAVELGPVAPMASLRLVQTAKQLAPEQKTINVAPGGTVIDEKGNVVYKSPATDKPRSLLQVDLGDRVELRDAVTGELVSTNRKGLTTSQQEKRLQEEAESKPGYIGKTGAYRNQFGEIISSTEMRTQREGFLQGQNILEKLNKIDYETVKQAESVFDYSEPGVTKRIGSQVSPKTVGAQTKIAAAQLLDQIQKLPPGSASDADMRASLRDFPGYGDAKQLALWVDSTKELLFNSLQRQQELYGFPVQIKPTASITPQQASSPSASPNAAPGQSLPTQRFNPATGKLEAI